MVLLVRGARARRGAILVLPTVAEMDAEMDARMSAGPADRGTPGAGQVAPQAELGRAPVPVARAPHIRLVVAVGVLVGELGGVSFGPARPGPKLSDGPWRSRRRDPRVTPMPWLNHPGRPVTSGSQIGGRTKARCVKRHGGRQRGQEEMTPRSMSLLRGSAARPIRNGSIRLGSTRSRGRQLRRLRHDTWSASLLRPRRWNEIGIATRCGWFRRF